MMIKYYFIEKGMGVYMKKAWKVLLAIALIGLLAAFAVGCGNNDEPAEDEGNAEQKQEFRVGMECAYAPFNWTQTDDSNGAVPISNATGFANGYDVQIAKLIAEELGRELVIEQIEWDGLSPALQSGTIDAIIAGMSPTEERKQMVDFSDIYYTSDLVMVVRADSEYVDAKSIQDFSGASITAQRNTFHYTVIDQIEGVKKETEMDSFGNMRVALESGVIDGYVSERPEGVSATAANKNFVMVEFEEGFETSPDDVAIAVAIAKGNDDLLKQINDILATIPEDERLSLMDDAIKNQPVSAEDATETEDSTGEEGADESE